MGVFLLNREYFCSFADATNIYQRKNGTMRYEDCVRRVERFVADNRLLGKEKSVLVALSGGSDSVALLRLLLSLGYCCEAAHCNFQLRGEESERDEQFVRSLCHELQVRLHTVRFDTLAYAGEQHLSVEMAARALRYDWFEQLVGEGRMQAVAVAHHRDDSIETMLINLLRGTGIDGLTGIAPRNGHVVRPLLCLTHQEILECLSELGQPYVTDSTNLEDHYLRNKIRLNLLPMMEQINPSVRHSLEDTMEHLRQVADLYHHAANEQLLRLTTSTLPMSCPTTQSSRSDAGAPAFADTGAALEIPIRQLAGTPSPQALLHELLAPRGFNSAQERDIFQSLNGPSGRFFYSKTHLALKDRDLLYIEPSATPAPPRLEEQRIALTDGFQPPRSAETACLDASKLTQPLSLRLCREGDWFIPLGMRGRKKLSDFLTDCKVPLHHKRQQYVVCCGEDIVWVVGRRIDNRFRIDASTREAVVVRCLI